LMQVEIISEVAPSVINPPLNTFGLARWLTRNSRSAKKEVVKVNFSCQYCVYQSKKEDTEALVDEVSTSALEDQNSRYEQLPGAENAKSQGKQEFNKFNFNGLRSHLSSK